MDYIQNTEQSFDCVGMTVTVAFSAEGKLLQDCMTDVLRSHIETSP